MKKNKKILIVLILIVAVIAFTAACFFGKCDFVRYVKKPDNNNFISDEIKELQEDYVDRLYGLTSSTKYRENEQRIYAYAVQDAENELHECFTQADLDRVLDKHLSIIDKIKTDEDYSREEEENAINAYRTAILGQAAESYVRQKYTEAQIEYFDRVFAAFSDEISEMNVKEEMSELLRNFYFEIHKEDEILSLINNADISTYEDAHKEILKNTLNKCIDDIRGCDSEESIEEIKSVYVFEVYKRNTIKKLNEYVSLLSYRAEQVDEIKAILNEQLKLAEKAETAIEEDNIFREYQIAVYNIPTHEMLYNEELGELKEELNSSLSNTYKLSFYREAEGVTVRELLESFEASIDFIDNKEDVLSEYILAKNKLDAVKTAEILDEEDRVNLIEELYVNLLNIIETNIEGIDREEYLLKAENAYLDMQDRKSLDGVRAVYKALAREMAVKFGTDLDIVKEELNEYNDSVFYREKEKNEVNEIKEIYLAKFTDEISPEEATALLQEAKDAIDAIKTNDDLWNDSVNVFRADLKLLYGDAILEEPRSLVEAYDVYELAKIIDYYAFYQLNGTEFVCDTFRVKLNFAHGNAESEINNVYWNCELLRSGAGIYGELEQSHYLVINLIPYNLASISNRETTERIERNKSLIEFKSEGQTIARGADFDNFPYKSNVNKIEGIWNTQQLWYALEHGYNPVCVVNSPADKVLNKAKEILREIIKENMSDDEKVFSIYSWFARNVQYDYQYTNDFYQSVLERYPEAATSNAFHAEGAILDGLAVCEGYAKAYLLMLRLEGIESYRIVMSPAAWGRIIQNSDGNKYYADYIPGYGSHAFVGIRMEDGLLYYSDPEQTFAGEGQNLQMFQQFMVPSSLFTGYWGKTFFKPDVSEGETYWSGYNKLSIGDVSLFVNNIEELTLLADLIKEQFNNNSDICISIYTDLKVYSSFSDDFMSLFDCYYIKKSSSDNNCEFTEYILF